jgi:hypothetical protein
MINKSSISRIELPLNPVGLTVIYSESTESGVTLAFEMIFVNHSAR